MKVQITYTLNSNPSQQREDILRWPDISTLEEVEPHIKAYLDTQYGTDQYSIIGIEAVE